MLQKKYLDKLPPVDRDRLLEVISIIEVLKMKFPNATISKELEKDKSEVSAYLNAKKPMSTNFYETFIQRFGKKENNEALLNQETLINASVAVQDLNREIILGLVRSGQTLADANKTLADSNKSGNEANKILAQNSEKLIRIVEFKYLPNSALESDNQLTVAEVLQPYLNKIAKQGVAENWWPSYDEGLLKLNKTVIASEEVSIE